MGNLTYSATALAGQTTPDIQCNSFNRIDNIYSATALAGQTTPNV
jgi:hypothetical protein